MTVICTENIKRLNLIIPRIDGSLKFIELVCEKKILEYLKDGLVFEDFDFNGIVNTKKVKLVPRDGYEGIVVPWDKLSFFSFPLIKTETENGWQYSLEFHKTLLSQQLKTLDIIDTISCDIEFYLLDENGTQVSSKIGFQSGLSSQFKNMVLGFLNDLEVPVDHYGQKDDGQYYVSLKKSRHVLDVCMDIILFRIVCVYCSGKLGIIVSFAPYIFEDKNPTSLIFKINFKNEPDLHLIYSRLSNIIYYSNPTFSSRKKIAKLINDHCDLIHSVDNTVYFNFVDVLINPYTFISYCIYCINSKESGVLDNVFDLSLENKVFKSLFGNSLCDYFSNFVKRELVDVLFSVNNEEKEKLLLRY